MATVSERKILLVGCNKLITSMVSCRSAFTDLSKAETVKAVTTRIIGFVMINRVRRNLDAGSGWYVLTI
jgi:hypothetical protein